MIDGTDIAVIGGGIAGVSAAAAMAGNADVTLLEAEPQPGYHATGRSAAVFILNYGSPTLRALNARAYPTLSEGIEGASLLSACGELLVATTESMPALEAYLEGAEGMTRVTPDEAVAMVPVLKRDRIAGAAFEPRAERIDVDRLMQFYLRKLKSAGGRVLTAAPVQAISREQNRWNIVTPSGQISAGIVVNAAGAWADCVASLAGVARIGVQPLRRSAVMMPVPAQVRSFRDWPLFASAAEDWYAKPEATGLMISPAEEDPVEPHDAWPDDLVIAEGLDRFSQMVDIPLVRPTHSWAGLRSFVPDRNPVCGFDDEAPGFFWLAGQGGYGVQTAPALSALTAALCLGEHTGFPTDLVEALNPKRLRKAL